VSPYSDSRDVANHFEEVTWAHFATVPEHGDACLCVDFSPEDACRLVLGREPNYRHGEIEITDLVKCVEILTRDWCECLVVPCTSFPMRPVL
jgi:hypothetical protein